MVDILKRKIPYVTHGRKAIFISCVADDLSLHSSLFSIFYIGANSTNWKLYSLGYYTPRIPANSPQMPTQHGPARWIKETCGLCSGSTIRTMPQSVPPVLHGHEGHTKYVTLFASLCLAHIWAFPEDLHTFAKFTLEKLTREVKSLLHQHFT